MIIHDFEQNSPEWYAARMGIITASTFPKVLTAKTMKLSASAEEIENRIVAEILTSGDNEGFSGNMWTERGHDLEPDAVALYEMTTGNSTTEVGFITNGEKTIGCSPDRLVGKDGGLEIKCPAAHTHIASYLSGSVADDHKQQVQGTLMITKRKWWDVMSYHPELPPSIVRVKHDEEYIGHLEDALNQMVANIQNKISKLKGEKT